MTARHPRLLVRVLLVVAVFAGVGWLTSHLVVARAVAHGTPEYAVRLAGYMSGLFVGGVAAMLAGLAMLLAGRGSSADDETTP